jgi:hypothetical protein
MEKLFDALEKAKKEKSDEVNSLIPSEHQLIEWLKGFQDVQTELNACVGCLEEGVSQINVLQGDDEKDDIFDYASQYTGLHARTNGHHFIRVYALVRLLAARHLANQVLYRRNTGGTTHQHHFVNVAGADFGVF